MKFADIKALLQFVLGAKLPNWQSTLQKKFADAIKVHSQGQIFYKIDRLFPNETPNAKHHRMLSFESITEPSFSRAANNINRIFKNSSYTVEASDETLQFLSAHNFDGKNFYTWFLDQWTEIALKTDPNSRFVVYPPDYVEQYGRQCCFVTSDFLKYSTKDAVIFISEEESIIEYDLSDCKLGTQAFFDQTINAPNVREVVENTYTPKLTYKIKRHVYHAFFNGLGMYRIEEIEKGKDFDVEFFPIDFIPVTEVGGISSHKGVNKSFLQPFVPFGNLALFQHSQHTAVNFMFSFPRMSEVEVPCDAPDCQDGRIMCETEADRERFGEYKQCSRCGGNGWITPQSPYKIYKKRLDPNGMEGDNSHIDYDDVKYYTPDTLILNYSKQEWKDYLEQAETAVYIQQRVKTGNTEAAKSKEIDREDMYAFLSRVGQVLFSCMRYGIQCFENYMIKSPVEVVVNNPYSYAILSEGEAFDEMKSILESQVPVMLKGKQVQSFVNKFTSQSSPLRKFLDVLKIVDPLLYYTDLTLTQWKISGSVTTDQMAVHIFAFPILEKLYSEDMNLFLEDTQTIADKLLTALEEYKQPPQTDIKKKFIGQQQQ